MFGVAHTTTGTYSRRYVVHAHPVEAAKESPRDSSCRTHVEGTYHTAVVECFRVESSCKCSFGRLNLPAETLSFSRVTSRASCVSRSDECLSSRGNFDETHHGVVNSRCELYTRGRWILFEEYLRH